MLAASGCVLQGSEWLVGAVGACRVGRRPEAAYLPIQVRDDEDG